jgi:hypothetical protein
MKHLFVPYELALLAKEKGFDEPCFAKFTINGEFVMSRECVGDNPYKTSNIYPAQTIAPLYQQLVDWFRDKHTIDIVYIPAIGWQIQTYNKTMDKYTFFESDMPDNRYETSRQKALTEAFKLIQP